MTNREAVSELRYARAMFEFNPMTGENGFWNDEDRRQAEALDMAIRALERIPDREEVLEAVCGEIMSSFDVPPTYAYDAAERALDRVWAPDGGVGDEPAVRRKQ